MENEKKRKINKSDLQTLKWIYNTGKSQRWKVLTVILAYVVNACMTVGYANFSKNIVNAATIEKSWQRVVYYAVCFLILISVQLAMTLISRSQIERCRCKLEWIIKQHMLQVIMKKDYAKVTAFHTGELQNRIHNDVNVITEGFTTILPNLIFFVTRLVSAFAYLVVIDKVFALVFLLGGTAVFLCTQFFRKTIKRLHKQVQQTEGKTRSFIQEAVTSLLVVKAFVVEKKMCEKADELQAENYRMRMKQRFFSIAANAGVSVVFNLGYVFALVFGAYRLIHGLDYGTVTAMLQLVNQIQQPFAALSSIMPKYFTMLASAERLIELENLPDETAHSDAKIDVSKVYNSLSEIRFDGITFRYDRDVVLEDTSLTLKKGDFAAIMGISGIGKSTLLKLLLGVFNTQGGTIELVTEDENIPVDYKTRVMFSYVPQGNFILSGTIRENLTFINSEATEEEIREAIRISCAEEFISALPDGLETVIGERGIGLSEGQLQRLAIARSLLSKAPIMLLDEATSALDEATELQFLSNLKALKNKTCIIVSHKRAALQICNKHIQIIDAKIVTEEKEEYHAAD